jgi:hypothetical protein
MLVEKETFNAAGATILEGRTTNEVADAIRMNRGKKPRAVMAGRKKSKVHREGKKKQCFVRTPNFVNVCKHQLDSLLLSPLPC